MQWFQKFINYLFGPEPKPPTPVQVKDILKVPGGTSLVVSDMQRILYKKTLPIHHNYRRGQIIMANLDTWNKLT